MKAKIKILLNTAFVFFVSNSFAYYAPGSEIKKPNIKPQSSQEKGANCAPSNYRLTFEYNDVKCQLETGGLLFLDRANGLATYRVPKNSKSTMIYAAALWMGGTDINNQLKLAAVRFRNDGNDFWSGPLTVTPNSGNYDPLEPQSDTARRDYGDANIDPDRCLFYDNIFTISKAGVISFITYWECTNDPAAEGCDDIQAPSNEVLAQINAWPGNGDVTRLEDQYLAPFKDVDEDGFYDPENGDYPWYDDILGRDDVVCGSDRRVTLFGDETNWWVFNDKGNIHTESQGDPIGMEVRAQAFAFSTDDEINRMTFYNYELINRGTQELTNTYFSQYVDVDLGNYNDDFAGCDVSRGLSYMYNGDATDETNGSNIGFGANPPAIGVDFFEGPYQDADGIDNPGPNTDSNGVFTTPSVATALAQGGIVYRGLGIGYGDGIIDNERYGMRNFSIYTSTAGSGQSDPISSNQYYNYMQGLWQFGAQLFYGGTGFPGAAPTTIETNYMFPHTSDPLNWATGGIETPFEDWSEAAPSGFGSTPNPAGDRRFVQSAGPFTLKPGAVNNITVGIVYARSTQGQIFSSVDALRAADTKAQALFDNCFRILEPPTAPKVQIQELENELIIMLENPKTSNNYQETYQEEDKINIVDPTGLGDTLANGDPIIYDKFYRFEGYQIFQMKTAESGIGDLSDPTKARLVAQCDKKNGVTRLINFEFNEDLGFSIPTEKVKGEDKGIRHSFRVTQDLFATGDSRLVNHKTYYYIAVAYGYNNYKNYNPNDALLLDGQKLPYLRSRINADGTTLTPIPGVPHNVGAEQQGTVQNAVYGQTPRITRIDGIGNGGNNLKLTAESEDAIVKTGKLDKLQYDYFGAPVNIKVVDPLNVVGGYFECKFKDYSGASGTGATNFSGIDTAEWVIYRYASEGGALLDSISSESSIRFQNEQIIPEWGVSVEITQNKYFYPTGTGAGPNPLTTDPISSSITFTDDSKPWLRFIEDDAAFAPTNWIRNGNYEPVTPDDCDPTNLVGNPCLYPDLTTLDVKQAYNKLLGGGIAPHRLVGFEGPYMPLAYPVSYPGFSTARNEASISRMPSVDIVLTSDKSKWTRCPVVELGRDPALNVGGGKPGEMRKSSSKDINGNDEAGTGMSWFPGYAIDLETGARLHLAFGENSFLGGDGGSDMKWNPSSRIQDNSGNWVVGGNQPIWVFGININGTGCPNYDPNNVGTNWLQDRFTLGTSPELKKLFVSLCWIANPILREGYAVNDTEARISIRINKQYADYIATNNNGGKPTYSWNMDDLATVKNSNQELSDNVLNIINIVPNPYYAFSEYERNRIDSRVKITNLPSRCTVSIFNTSGKLIRQYKKDNEVTSIDWDLKNPAGVPISSGVYLIHVEVPEVGERVIKFFCGMRQIDLESI
jgi:hypothetical protein